MRGKPRPSERERIARTAQRSYALAAYSAIPSMQRLQAFKYQLMSTGEQQRQMRRFAGSCRFVFNQTLALQR